MHSSPALSRLPTTLPRSHSSFYLMRSPPPPGSTLFPYTTLFRSMERALDRGAALLVYPGGDHETYRPSWESSEIDRSEEHTSELQSRPHLVCRLLLEKKKTTSRCAATAQRLAACLSTPLRRRS